MSDYPALSSTASAEALLQDVRALKQDRAALDAVVWEQVRKGVRVPDLRSDDPVLAATKHRRCAAPVWAAIGTVGANGWLSILEALTFLNLSYGYHESTIPVPLLVTAPVLGAVYGARAWRNGGAQIEATGRAVEFLRAGVRVEVALDGLALAIGDAHRGARGAVRALAEQCENARAAVETYVGIIEQLDDSDLMVRFPWATRDLDLDLARSVLGVNAEATLAQLGILAAEAEARAAIEPALDRSGAGATGGLNALILAALAVRRDFTKAEVVLDGAEAALRQAACASDREEASHGVDVVAEARLHLALVDADCQLIENAARTATRSDASAAVRHLDEAATTTTVVAAFEAYALHLVKAVTHLAAPAVGAELEAGAARLQADLARLGAAVGTLAAMARKELPQLEFAARS